MTDLDDALNSSNVVFHPPEVTAEWQELWPNYDPGNSSAQFDDLRDLGQQLGADGYTVSHSLDDGLPDPVTMTGGGDASGQMEVALVGRPSNIADVFGFRTVMPGASGTGTSITITPSLGVNVFINDQVMVGVVISSAVTYTDNQSLDDPWRWKLVSSVVDGAIRLLVYTLPVYYSGVSSLVITTSASAAWTWQGVASIGGTFPPSSGWVQTKVGDPVTFTETVSQTTHTFTNPVYMPRRGYVVSFWATDTSNAWTTPMTEVSESASAPRLMLARANAIKQQDWTELASAITASTASATATVAAVAVPLMMMDRPNMDALQYFSPFNPESPIFGFDRDTAPVTLAQPVISPNGPVSTQLFKGTMVDIPVTGRTVTMQAVSQGRLDVDRVLEIPVVRANREGSSIDWMVAYILAHGRQFIGPKASAYTRWWIPMYGSGHAFVDNTGKDGYYASYRYRDDSPGTLLTMEPVEPAVPGPFVTGMYGQYHDDEVIEVSSRASKTLMKGGCTQLGFDPIPDHTNDLMSKANNKGRMTVWLRGDVTHPSNPDAIVGAPTWTNTLFRYRLNCNKNDISRGAFWLVIREDRQILLRMGSTSDGMTELLLSSSTLPSDGEWHLLSVRWDWENAECRVRLDNTTWAPSGWAATTSSLLPDTDEAWYAEGGNVHQEMHACIPVSDFMVESGQAAYDANVDEFWPSLTGESGAVTYRATMQPLDSIALDAPIQGWETLGELARAAGAHYRMNENDKFEFLPRSYFGESQQMTPVVVVDTEVNASDLNVALDPSKSRNVVTIEFDDVTTDFWSSYTINVTSAVELPKGINDITFTSDESFAEIFGAADQTTYFALVKLTAANLATPSTIPTNRAVMSVNTKSDGSGTVYASSGIRARIVDWNSNSVTIRFWNSYGASLWLANDGVNEVPFLKVRTYPVRTATGYTTQRDSGSIGIRRERALSTQVKWIHDRATAENMAGQMVNEIARPRPQLTIETVMDPRRKPGQLVTVADSQGTQADGTWRVLSVTHNGGSFTQTLQLVQVLPIAVWDGADGWDNASWSE